VLTQVSVANGNGNIQSSADFCKHVPIDPRAVAVRTCHSPQTGCAWGEPSCGVEPDAAVGTSDLRWMLMTHIFDDGSDPRKNLLAQRLVVKRRYIFETHVKLIESLTVSPSAMMVGASHSAEADSDSGVEALAALGTLNGFDVLAPEPFEDLFITLASPLILTRQLKSVDLVAETVFLLDHIFLRAYPGS